jgi:hypothetical protein
MKDSEQREICWLAEEMLKQVKEISGDPFKHTIDTFGY